MKKLLVLFVLLIVSIVGVKAQQTYDVCVDGIYYDIFSDRTATVTYMHNLNPEYDKNYLAYSGNVVIPEEITYRTVTYRVTRIDAAAFHGCKNLISITIPNSIISIGSAAFVGCTGLTSVHIYDISAWCNTSFGDGDKSNPLNFAHHLYLNDTEVKDLRIPDDVTFISNRGFEGCSGLTSVTIPNSVTKIGDYAFSGCI